MRAINDIWNNREVSGKWFFFGNISIYTLENYIV